MNKQRLSFRIVLVMLWAAVTAVGCAKRGDAPFGIAGEAEVRLTVALDQAENMETVGGFTKTSAMPVVDPYKDLAVYVINTHEDTLARWACFDEVPERIKFKAGAYKIVAEYKPAGIRFPVFDTYTYRAEEKFVIAPGDALDISLVAKLGTAKVSVEFDPSFDFYYQSYSIDVRTVGVDSLRFGTKEAKAGKCGFFEPGSIRMRFNLVTKEGQKLVFSPAPLAKAQAADYYKLKLKVSSDVGSTQVIVIGTNDGTNDKGVITIEIPKYFLPKDRPVMHTPVGFVSGVHQELFEGAVPKWKVGATVPGGLASFVIRLNDGVNGVLGTKLGLAAAGADGVIDLATLPEDHQLRTKLREAGFVWSEGLNSPEDAAIASDVWVDFTDVMVASGDGSPAGYDFSFELKDNYDQTPDDAMVGGGYPCRVTATVKAPTVTFVEPVPGNIWSTKAEFLVKANYDLYNGAHPVLQYKKASSANWNDAEEKTAENPDGEVTISALPNDGDLHAAQYVLRGLQPGMAYEFRIVSGGRPSTAYALNTEAQTQLPNSNFTDYTTTPRFGGIVQYEWTGGWATRNAATTGQTAYSKSGTGDGMETSVGDVTSHNSVASLRLDDGSIAIQLNTTGWGRGSYSQKGDAGNNTGSWWGGRAGNKATDAYVANMTAGVLYLGSYQCGGFTSENRTWEYAKAPGNVAGSGMNSEIYSYDKLNSETLNETGIVFASRPTSLSFGYIFAPKWDDGKGGNFKIRAELIGEDTPGHEVILATAELEDGNAQASIIKKTLPFSYNSAYLLVKATRIKVFFSSSVALGGVPGAIPTGFQGGNPPLAWQRDGTRHRGNTLTIQSVSLGYDF